LHTIGGGVGGIRWLRQYARGQAEQEE